MNAPRELLFAGAWPGITKNRSLSDFLAHPVLFLVALNGHRNEQDAYETALLDSQGWRESQGMAYDAGYIHPVEIIQASASGLRGLLWTAYPGFHARYPSEYCGPAPYRLLLFSGRASLLSWKAQEKPSLGFSVHPRLFTPDGRVIEDGLLLALHNG